MFRKYTFITCDIILKLYAFHITLKLGNRMSGLNTNIHSVRSGNAKRNQVYKQKKLEFTSNIEVLPAQVHLEKGDKMEKAVK